MQLEKYEFVNEFFYKKSVYISPQVVAELLDALEEKFNSTLTPTNTQSKPCPSCGSLDTVVEEYKCVDCNSWFSA